MQQYFNVSPRPSCRNNKSKWRSRKKTMLLWIKKKRNNDSNLSSKQKERKEIFYKLFKERFKELIQWTGKTNFNDLIKYHKGMSRKRFDDFNDPIKLWKKIEDHNMNLKEAKNDQNEFEWNLNKIKNRRFKSEETKVQCKISKCCIQCTKQSYQIIG